MTRINVPLTLRQRTIILRVAQSTERLTYEKLAHLTGLSIRTIRYNMSPIRAWFASHNVRLTSRPGFGVEIDAGRAARRQLLSALAHYVDEELVLSGVQRRRAFLFELLTAEAPISFQRLATHAGSSRSTLIHDAAKIQDWLRRYGITLVRRPKRGISLDTEEHMRRFAIVRLLQEELGEERWVRIGELSAEALRRDKSLPAYIQRYLKNIDLPFSGVMMTMIENNLARQLAPSSHAAVLVYLAVTIQALRNHRTICSLSAEHVAQTPEYDVARILVKEIARRVQVDVAEPEAVLLAAYLLGSEWEPDGMPSGQDRMSPEEPSAEAVALSRELVSSCAAQLHPLLQIDQELIRGLAFHLGGALYRLRHGIPVYNSLLEQVRGRYAEVHRIAAQSAQRLEPELGGVFSEDEVGFLTMYLAAALERIGTNRHFVRPVLIVGDGNRAKTTLLRSRLEYEFPNLEIAGICEAASMTDAAVPKCESIISLVPIQHPPLPTLQVSPFLSTDELKSIRTWLRTTEAQERRAALSQRTKLGIVELLDPASIVFHLGDLDWRSSVRLAAQPLLDAGKITPGYIPAMTQILEEFGPYMILAPGVILLHAKPSDGVNSLCFSLLVNREGIDFGGPVGRIQVVFVLCAVDNQSHLTALFQLNSLIQDPGFVKDICQTSQASDALRTIWRYLMSASGN